jgi:type II secretory pathway component GspD/PulD (secretin)
VWPTASVLLLGAAFGLSAAAQGDAPAKKDKKTAAPDAAKAVTLTRIFTPKNTDPAEVLQAIELFLERAAALNRPAGGAALAGPPGLVGGLPAGPGGGLMPGAAGLPQLGGLALGGGLGAGPAESRPYESRLALDERTGSIVMRGPESEVQTAADLVTLLDTPAGKPLPEVKSLRAFPLKHAEPGAIAELLTIIDVRAAAVALDEAKLLLVAGPPEALREVGDLLKALDVPTPKAPQPEKLKRLFSGGPGGA